jgi:RNA polymerase sigma-70 factor (ECF subfamily)
MNARQAVELAARNSYGRLIAYLTAQSRDLAVAEDALSDAFLAALTTWAERGIPANPEAWLLVTARHRLIDALRHAQLQDRELARLLESAVAAQSEPSLEEVVFPDERLKLLFVCAHPAIDAALHTPLMLQTVLGLNAAQIASAFLVAPTTMSQRLVRAKAKIRDAGIAFELPTARELPMRLQAVLSAIYAAYTNGWETVTGSDPRQRGLTEAAVWLARLCVQLMPEAPEARGLLSLILYCEARREARRDADGCYIPLSHQSTARWSQSMLAEAERELAQAATFKQLGRFQLEAAIQSIHAQRIVTQQIDWQALVLLYEGLIQLSPTLGALVSHIAAISEVKGYDQGLEQLDAFSNDLVKSYQPYWALKAHLLKQSGRKSEARQAYLRAIGLTEDPAVRKFLLQQSSKIDGLGDST